MLRHQGMIRIRRQAFINNVEQSDFFYNPTKKVINHYIHVQPMSRGGRKGLKILMHLVKIML